MFGSYASGSSGVYFEIWQWAIAVSAFCCVCCTFKFLLCGKKKKGKKDKKDKKKRKAITAPEEPEAVAVDLEPLIVPSFGAAPQLAMPQATAIPMTTSYAMPQAQFQAQPYSYAMPTTTSYANFASTVQGFPAAQVAQPQYAYSQMVPATYATQGYSVAAPGTYLTSAAQ